MKKLWVIIKREYLSRVKKRSFLITTLLVPLLIIGFYALMGVLMATNAGGTKKKIAVVDESGYFADKPFRDSKTITFKKESGSLEEVKSRIEENDYHGILYIPEFNIYRVNDNIKYLSDNKLGLGPKEYVENELERHIKAMRMEDKEIERSVLDVLRVSMDLTEPGLDEKETGVSASEILAMLGFIIGMILYMTLMIFGTQVMRGVMEEKTNRIVEVIVSSVKPMQLMFGKIIGISLVGITQFLIWTVIMYAGYIVLSIVGISSLGIDPGMLQNAGSGGGSAQAADLEGIEKVIVPLFTYGGYPKLILTALFYFLGGYLIYAAMFSAVGSAVNDESESQQLVFPVMMPIIFSVLILVTLFNDPHNKLAVIGSIFPLTSPIVMPARMPFDPPTWQIIASVLALIAGTWFFVWLSAKVYRVGILLYGKKPSFKELLKWMRY